jgi:hypothetical protein
MPQCEYEKIDLSNTPRRGDEIDVLDGKRTGSSWRQRQITSPIWNGRLRSDAGWPRRPAERP